MLEKFKTNVLQKHGERLKCFHTVFGKLFCFIGILIDMNGQLVRTKRQGILSNTLK